MKLPYIRDTDDNKDIDGFDEVKIGFKLWTTVDWNDLTSLKLSLSKLIDLLCEKIDKIIPNHLLQGHSQVTWHILKKTVGSN